MTGIVRSPHHEGNPMLYVNRRLRKRTRGASLSPGSRSLSASICPDRSSSRSSLQWDDGWPVFPSISRSRTGPDCGLTGAITLKLHQVHSNWPKLANIFTASLHRPCTMKEQAMSGRCCPWSSPGGAASRTEGPSRLASPGVAPGAVEH